MLILPESRPAPSSRIRRSRSPPVAQGRRTVAAAPFWLPVIRAAGRYSGRERRGARLLFVAVDSTALGLPGRAIEANPSPWVPRPAVSGDPRQDELRQRGRAAGRAVQPSPDVSGYHQQVCGRDREILRPSGHVCLWMDKFILCGYGAAPIFPLDWTVDLITWDKGKIGMGYRTRRRGEYLMICQKPPRRAKGIWQDHGIPDVWPEKKPAKGLLTPSRSNFRAGYCSRLPGQAIWWSTPAPAATAYSRSAGTPIATFSDAMSTKSGNFSGRRLNDRSQ